MKHPFKSAFPLGTEVRASTSSSLTPVSRRHVNLNEKAHGVKGTLRFIVGKFPERRILGAQGGASHKMAKNHQHWNGFPSARRSS
jgi:hypothetical protein